MAIAGMWLNTWKPSVSSSDRPGGQDRAVILEDDLQVSTAYAQWVNAAHDYYRLDDVDLPLLLAV